MAFLKRYLTDVTQSPGTPAGKRQETRFCKLLKINALAILPSFARRASGWSSPGKGSGRLRNISYLIRKHTQ
jgi:hypothetical protein